MGMSAEILDRYFIFRYRLPSSEPQKFPIPLKLLSINILSGTSVLP